MTNAPWLKNDSQFEKLRTKYGFELNSNPLHAEAIVEGLEAWYEATKNPFFIWHAIAQAKYAKVDFPQWVFPYLYESAINIYKLSEKCSAKSYSKPMEFDASIAKCLNFKADKTSGKGKRGSLKHYNDLARATKLYRETMKIMRQNKCSQAKAIEKLLALSLVSSEQTAKNDLADIKKLFGKDFDITLR